MPAAAAAARPAATPKTTFVLLFFAMMSFFKLLTEQMEGYSIQLFVKRKDDVISVMVSPVVEGKDKDYFPPFTISGSADELDEKFLSEIPKVTTLTREVVSDISSFEEQMKKKRDEEKENNTHKPKVSGSAVAKAKAKAKKKEATPAEKMEKFIKQGKDYFDRKRFKQAIASFEEALKFASGKKKDEIKKLQMDAKVKKMAAVELGDYKESEDVADPTLDESAETDAEEQEEEKADEPEAEADAEQEEASDTGADDDDDDLPFNK